MLVLLFLSDFSIEYGGGNDEFENDATYTLSNIKYYRNNVPPIMIYKHYHEEKSLYEIRPNDDDINNNDNDDGIGDNNDNDGIGDNEYDNGDDAAKLKSVDNKYSLTKNKFYDIL